MNGLSSEADSISSMKRIWIALAVGIFVVGFLLISSGGLPAKHEARKQSASTRTVLYYRDPMHPSYTSDKPGTAPDCGMALEPVYAIENSKGNGNPAEDVFVTDEQRQMIGLQTVRVNRSPPNQTLRVPGRVALDESRIFPLIASGDGYITQILGGTTDSQVKKGQALLNVYGRDYMMLQRTLLYALRAADNPPPLAGDYQDPPTLTLEEARLNLTNSGVSEDEIRRLTATRQVMLNVTLTSPASGTVIRRNVLPGQKFTSGTELFRIADLRKLWIVVDLFAGDSQFVPRGAYATVTVPGRPDLKFRAQVTDSLPSFNGESRSLKLRLEIENPGLALRPEMLVDVQFPVQRPSGITVPADAVIDHGLQKAVFVDKGDGHFERRVIETGRHLGNEIEVLHGLTQGESVVVSGSFLLDSQSQMQQGSSASHD